MKNWDIFCRVVDNYGDIGVCWRLARQLADEYPFQVRLWVDDLQALQRIWPETTLNAHQHIQHVVVCQWEDSFDPNITPADTVIEAFACELPATYLSAMRERKQAGQPPHWFNLEYLSAESWVEECHGLVSMHPSTGMKKVFFFPGFTSKTGGLIAEQKLFAERDAFQENTQAKTEFLQELGVNLATSSTLISLFGYENPTVGHLLNQWQRGTQHITCLVPEGKILTSINEYLGRSLHVGDTFTKDNLLLIVIPFINQQDYDRLLWACDINFVRGEDSFVRAQWAAKPMIWHIYPQEDNAHIIKLNAFLDKYTHTMPPELAESVKLLWQGWNQAEMATHAWDQCLENHHIWQQNATKWAAHLNSLGDLASNMVQFCQKTL